MITQTFNPYSYADQLRKNLPDRADKILVEYGWIERLPGSRITQNRLVYCLRCTEEFRARNGRQKYCTNNSRKENCSSINRKQKIYARRHS